MHAHAYPIDNPYLRFLVMVTAVIGVCFGPVLLLAAGVFVVFDLPFEHLFFVAVVIGDILLVRYTTTILGVFVPAPDYAVPTPNRH
jgi:hypothetical protein